MSKGAASTAQTAKNISEEALASTPVSDVATVMTGRDINDKPASRKWAAASLVLTLVGGAVVEKLADGARGSVRHGDEVFDAGEGARKLLPEITPSTQEAVGRLIADSSRRFPRARSNARRAIVGPGGVIGDVAGEGVPGGDVVFRLSDGVLRREVKSVSGGASAFSKRVSEGANQIDYSGEIFVQVPSTADLPSFLENFRSRRSAEALEKYKSIRLDVVDPQGNVLYSGPVVR